MSKLKREAMLDRKHEGLSVNSPDHGQLCHVFECRML